MAFALYKVLSSAGLNGKVNLLVSFMSRVFLPNAAFILCIITSSDHAHQPAWPDHGQGRENITQQLYSIPLVSKHLDNLSRCCSKLIMQMPGTAFYMAVATSSRAPPPPPPPPPYFSWD